MDTSILCIAGGSGAGKTTLAEGLVERLGDRASLLSLDNYQKSRCEVPQTASGRPNYDHPAAVDWTRYINDVAALRCGSDISLRVKRKHSSMDGGVLPAEIVTIKARPLVIVEGYLALWHADARGLYDLALFLDGPAKLRLARRRWSKDPDYVSEVLLPMHRAHVEPTKRFADRVIKVARLSKDEVLETALAELARRGLI